MNSGRILLVDDEVNLRMVIQTMLERAQFEVVSTGSPLQAIEILEEEEFDAIVTDLVMPEGSGLDLMKKVQTIRPGLPMIMITAHGTIEIAVEALKQGAFDFITKPFGQSDLVTIVQKAAKSGIKLESEPSLAPVHARHLGWIKKIANIETPVLLIGQPGTGKDWVASEIHHQSNRKSFPFIKVSLSLIAKDQHVQELFGQSPVDGKPGKVRLANLGTLFIDDLNYLSAEGQIQLIQELRKKTNRREVRFVLGAKTSLSDSVRQGQFSEELFHEIATYTLNLKSVSEWRAEDPLAFQQLLKDLIQGFSKRLEKSPIQLPVEIVDALEKYDWPGNFRQIENVIESLFYLSDQGELTSDDLPAEIKSSLIKSSMGETGKNLKMSAKSQKQLVERSMIQKALEETSGNVTKSAEKLGLSRKGLQLKMKALGISRQLRD